MAKSKTKSRTNRQNGYISPSSVGESLKTGNLYGKGEADLPREVDILREMFEAFGLSHPEKYEPGSLFKDQGQSPSGGGHC